MKSPAEVIAEGLISSIECKGPEEVKEPLRALRQKCIQINFPNLHEAIILHFEDDSNNGVLVRYEVYSTPIIQCRNCGWRGTTADLPIEEKKVEIKQMAELMWEQNALMNPTIRQVNEVCPKCGSIKLTKKDYRHKGRDLLIIGDHNEIAKLGTLMDPVIPHQVNGLINAFWSYFITEKLKLRPLWQLGLAIRFGRLLL